MTATTTVDTISVAEQVALLSEYGPVWSVQRTDTLEVWVVRAFTGIGAVERCGLRLGQCLVTSSKLAAVDDLPTRIVGPQVSYAELGIETVKIPVVGEIGG